MQLFDIFVLKTFSFSPKSLWIKEIGKKVAEVWLDLDQVLTRTSCMAFKVLLSARLVWLSG